MRPFLFTVVLFTLFHCTRMAQPGSAGRLLYSDDFRSFDSSRWLSEVAPLPSSSVYVRNGQLVLDTKGGVTTWFTEPLHGNIRVSYQRMVVVDSGGNDRLSDLNTFFMAADSGVDRPVRFTRDGVLERYDSMRMYYVGMGGNTNKTTRFRKYEGNGERKLIGEYTDSAHLLQANRWYAIDIEIRQGHLRYFVDGKEWFHFEDPDPIRAGYFGFRSTKSRQFIDRFRVYQLH